MATKKDFTQVAFDVMQRATGELPKHPPVEAQKQTAPKGTRGATKKARVPRK